MVGLDGGVEHLGMGADRLRGVLAEKGDVVDGGLGRIGGEGMRLGGGEDVEVLLHLRKEGGAGRVVPVARQEDRLLIALQGADDDGHGGQAVFLREREVCAGIDVAWKFDYQQRAPLFFARQGETLHVHRPLRTKHADAVGAAVVVDGGRIDGVHARTPAQLLKHEETVAALRGAVCLLDGDGVCAKLPDDLGNAVVGHLAVQAFGVSDVVAGQRKFGAGGALRLSVSGQAGEQGEQQGCPQEGMGVFHIQTELSILYNLQPKLSHDAGSQFVLQIGVNVVGTLKIEPGLGVGQLGVGIRGVERIYRIDEGHAPFLDQQSDEVGRYVFYHIVNVCHTFLSLEMASSSACTGSSDKSWAVLSIA